ncbi:MAG TPA: CPBP family intramembrane glutamic endopeptidase [Ktedonobacteraceae bacterium]
MSEQPPEKPGPSLTIRGREDSQRVPWTARQTLQGVLLTLVPWIGFNLLLQGAAGNQALTRPLSFEADLGAAVLQIVFATLIEGAFLIAPFYYASKTLHLPQPRPSRRAVREVLGLRGFPPGRTLPLIVGLLVLIIAANLLYAYAITALHLRLMTNDQVVLQESTFAPISVYAILASSVLIAPLCEEIFFRGFLLPGLLHEFSAPWALLISSLLFAVAHADLGSFAPLFAIGLCLGFLRLRTGSTWASLSLHMLNNLLSSLSIVLAMHNITAPF